MMTADEHASNTDPWATGPAPDNQWHKVGPHLMLVFPNAAQLQGTVDKDSGRIIVTSAIDNLGKGAAGQVVQCANLMLGFDETSGLPVAGAYPWRPPSA